MADRTTLAIRGVKWWRCYRRLYCPGCGGKHWLWRTVLHCDGE